MDVDAILRTFRRCHVRFLLIGGVNFLLRHKPVLTFDVDLWIEDTAENRRRCENALAALGAEWGATARDWGPVAEKPGGWLSRQGVYCLCSPHGAIDIFRTVRGLKSWRASNRSAVAGRTAVGTFFRGLSDADMLKCQLSLPPGFRKNDRIRDLRKTMRK
jgi:hypothetical protein